MPSSRGSSVEPPLKRLRTTNKIEDSKDDAKDMDDPVSEKCGKSKDIAPINTSQKDGQVATEEHPGDPLVPSTFIRPETNEQKLAAYLGYDNTSDLRIIAASWPVLRAVASFHPISINMCMTTTFILLHSEREAISRVDDPATEWQILAGDPTHLVTHEMRTHLASILLSMQQDFEIMNTSSASQNQTHHDTWSQAVKEHYKEIEIPAISYEAASQHESLSSGSSALVKVPNLGPLPEETDVEAFNRCWSLINPKQSAEANEISKSDAVEKADALPPKTFTVKWERSYEEDDLANGINKALRRAEASGMESPAITQRLRVDPRTLKDDMTLRDHIRLQYRCQDLKTDIDNLEIWYMTTSTRSSTGRVAMTANVQMDDWSGIHSILTSPDCDDCEFQVDFYPMHEDDAYRYISEVLDIPVSSI